MKISKLDAITFTILLSLISVEMYLKIGEILESPILILLGLIIGFSMGFKLASVHSSQISRKALDFAKNEEAKLNNVKSTSIETFSRLKKEGDRRDRVIVKLKDALKDRDLEVEHLVSELERKQCKR